MRYFTIVLTAVILIAFSSCSKEVGCTDPNADNYNFDAVKSDGSCLYNMTFWTNSEFGPMIIYIDGVSRDTLRYTWGQGQEPVCGDRIYAVSISLEPGTHEVFVQSFDGTRWESQISQPENCLKVLIEMVR
jgi:hypothetical protein